MASKKRWDTIYDKTNPFSLPQDIARQVRCLAREHDNGADPERMQYLWIYVSPVESEFAQGDVSNDRTLAADEWLIGASALREAGYDVFDALTTRRPYKKPWTVEEAVAELEKGKGTSFDPGLVDLFREILPHVLEIRRELMEREADEGHQCSLSEASAAAPAGD